MFVLTTMADSICIPPSMFAEPTIECVHDEIEKKYPNRVIMDVGLVISRYGDALEIGDGVCVAGDGGAHHEVVFQLVVFRPFVEEVCVGTIVESNEEGVRVSLGFFDDIFVPAYWMLRPSHYDKRTGLWVWTPNYGDEEQDDQEEKTGAQSEEAQAQAREGEDENRFEMEIGSEIRFKVKSLNFTQVTKTAKGVQATTTTTSQSSTERSRSGGPKNDPGDGTGTEGPVRKRSMSVDLTDVENIPASMNIVASICEDGLGLTSWWTSGEDEYEEEAEGEEVLEGDENQQEYDQAQEDNQDI